MVNVDIQCNGKKRTVAPRTHPRANDMEGYLYRSRMRFGDKVYFVHVGVFEIRQRARLVSARPRTPKSGVTARVRQMAQTLGISERTAWRRLREISKNGGSQQPPD